jgi:iron complex transport system ATP-binding protein
MVINHLSVQIQNRLIIRDVSFELQEGEFLGLIGPNGSGKTTLLQTILGFETPKCGDIHLGERPLVQWSPAERSQVMAFVQQERSLDGHLSVEDFVLLGGFPRQASTSFQSIQREARDLMLRLELDSKRRQDIDRLSGGEKQRAILAQALLQKPRILLLDELTNHLDIHFQLDVLKLLKGLPIAKLMAIHDLGYAARFCDRLLLLNKGRLAGFGRPLEVLTPANLKNVFRVAGTVHEHDGEIQSLTFH